MLKIEVSGEIKNVCPVFSGIAILAKVKNSPHNEKLWEEINILTSKYKHTHKLDNIKDNPAIAATRTTYRRLGKDPNRYRPSSEALCRRIIRDLHLYRIDTLVDLINLVSIKTGYSIGGFDADKIQGNILTLGVGKADEPYEAIGRGTMNIEGLPVYRDAMGGIGTPTSDHERTKISLSTTNFLAIINGYNGEDGLTAAALYMQESLREYANSDGGTIIHF